MSWDNTQFISFGEDVFIDSYAIIRRPYLCRIGNHVAIDNATISTALDIGDYVHISPYVSIIGGENGLLQM